MLCKKQIKTEKLMKEIEFIRLYDVKDLLGRQTLTSHGRRSSEIVLPRERLKTSLGFRTDLTALPTLRQSSQINTSGSRPTVRFASSKDGKSDRTENDDKTEPLRGRSLSIKSDSILLQTRNSLRNGYVFNKRRASMKSTSHYSKRRGSAYVHTYGKQDSGVFIEVKEVYIH